MKQPPREWVQRGRSCMISDDDLRQFYFDRQELWPRLVLVQMLRAFGVKHSVDLRVRAPWHVAVGFVGDQEQHLVVVGEDDLDAVACSPEFHDYWDPDVGIVAAHSMVHVGSLAKWRGDLIGFAHVDEFAGTALAYDELTPFDELLFHDKIGHGGSTILYRPSAAEPKAERRRVALIPEGAVDLGRVSNRDWSKAHEWGAKVRELLKGQQYTGVSREGAFEHGYAGELTFLRYLVKRGISCVYSVELTGRASTGPEFTIELEGGQALRVDVKTAAQPKGKRYRRLMQPEAQFQAYHEQTDAYVGLHLDLETRRVILHGWLSSADFTHRARVEDVPQEDGSKVPTRQWDLGKLEPMVNLRLQSGPSYVVIQTLENGAKKWRLRPDGSLQGLPPQWQWLPLGSRDSSAAAATP